MNELFREKHSPRLCNRDGRRSKMLKKQAPQLTFTQTQALSQLFNAISLAIEGSFSD